MAKTELVLLDGAPAAFNESRLLARFRPAEPFDASSVRPVNPVDIITRCVAAELGVHHTEIVSAQRFKHLAQERQVIARIARKRSAASFSAIGRRINKDHTTVLHGCRITEKRVASDSEFAAFYRRRDEAAERALAARGMAR